MLNSVIIYTLCSADDDGYVVRCRHGTAAGGTFSAHAPVTSPPTDQSQVSPQSQSSLSGPIRDLDSVSVDNVWPGHVIADDHSPYLNDVRSLHRPEVGEKNWNETGTNMADAIWPPSQDTGTTLPAHCEPVNHHQAIASAVQDAVQAAPVSPAPPPPPPAPVLAPLSITNLRPAGGATRTFPVTVFGVRRAVDVRWT